MRKQIFKKQPPPVLPFAKGKWQSGFCFSKGDVQLEYVAYHPQTDGTTEQVNKEIEAYLSIYCASHPDDWPQALHTLEFTHNN